MKPATGANTAVGGTLAELDFRGREPCMYRTLGVLEAGKSGMRRPLG